MRRLQFRSQLAPRSRPALFDLEFVFGWWADQSPAEKEATITRIRRECQAENERRRHSRPQPGERYHSWTVIGPAPPGSRGGCVAVRCDCGAAGVVAASALRLSRSRSCVKCTRLRQAPEG